MRLFATTALLAGLFAIPASAQTLETATHNTNIAGFRVFNTGYFGADRGVQTDTTFNFNGASPTTLYEGQLLVAVSPSQISGEPYASAPPTGSTTPQGLEWSLGTGPTAITPPVPFTQAYEMSYNDQGANNPSPAGISVEQRTYSRTGDAFVIVEVNVSSPLPRSNVYIGMFADYDISPTAILDKGGFDDVTKTVYAFGNQPGTAGNRNYYGVTVLGRNQSGWSDSAQIDGTDEPTSQMDLYESLTINGANDSPAATNGDRRLAIGTGPFTLASNVPQTVRFAYVAGTDLASLKANAAIARALFPGSTASDETPGEAQGLALATAQPNPAARSAEFAFTLDTAQDVRLAVYDVLGREVAVAVDGARGAGLHTATVNVSALPAGVYVARLVAGGQAVTSRFTVVR